MTAATEPLFLAGHPALDFLNTTFRPPDQTVEVIGDGAAFLRWLVQSGMLDAAAARKLERRGGAPALDAVAADARKLRGWTAKWIERWVAAPSGDYTAEWRRLNALLARANDYSEAVLGPDGRQVVARSRFEREDELLAGLALPIARLVSGESPELVRRCAGPACTLWFLDRTKAHRRMFCSASACGNRAKVAAFRERQRS